MAVISGDSRRAEMHHRGGRAPPDPTVGHREAFGYRIFGDAVLLAHHADVRMPPALSLMRPPSGGSRASWDTLIKKSRWSVTERHRARLERNPFTLYRFDIRMLQSSWLPVLASRHHCVCDGVIEALFCSIGFLFEASLDLGKRLLNRIEVWRTGRQIQEVWSAASMIRRTAATLWAGRLSITTPSPGRRSFSRT